MDATDRLAGIARGLSIGGLDRHLILCAEQTKPRCSTREESAAVWKYVKARLNETGLATTPPPWQGDPARPAGPVEQGSGRVLRTKADCLRVCEQGPIAVVYPDGEHVLFFQAYAEEDLDAVVEAFVATVEG